MTDNPVEIVLGNTKLVYSPRIALAYIREKNLLKDLPDETAHAVRQAIPVASQDSLLRFRGYLELFDGDWKPAIIAGELMRDIDSQLEATASAGN